MLTDDFDLYYDFKFIECIIFAESNHVEYGKALKRIECLRQFELFITDNRFMFDDVRSDNIYRILQNVVDVDDDYSLERITIVNNIKSILNNAFDKKEHYSFYKSEIVQRYGKKKYYKLKDSIIDEKKELINASIALDIAIIESHLFDKEMYDEYFFGLVDNPIYYMSLKAIINEYPFILANETFVSRVNTILNYSKKTKDNKKLVNTIKKLK